MKRLFLSLCITLMAAPLWAEQGYNGGCAVDWYPAASIPDGVGCGEGITYGAGQFVATSSSDAGGGFLTSSDGSDWTFVSARSSSYECLGVTWGRDLYVAVGTETMFNPAIQTSPDGETWTIYNPQFPTLWLLQDVAWNGELFVAVGYQGTIVTSPDGLTWTEHSLSGEPRTLVSVTWGGDKFVAVSTSYPDIPLRSLITTSPDGLTWTQRHPPKDVHLLDVTWGGNGFVAVGGMERSKILTSPDGVTWTQCDYDGDETLLSVAWGGNQYVAVGEDGLILTSPDGVTWTERDSGTTASLSEVAWGADRFVVVGGNNDDPTILVSPCDIEPDVTPLSNAQPRTISVNLEQDVYYSLDVPSGASNLSFLLDDLTADLDLYVKYGSLPTLSNYDCASYNYGTTSEECTFSSPQTGTYYVMVHGYEAGSGSLTGSYSSSCTFTISPSSKNFTSAGGSQVVTVTALSSSCAWTASENLDWVTLSSTGGTGSGSVTVSASANTGAARNGTVSIAEKTFSVSQQASSGYSRNKSMPWLLLLLE